MSGPTDTPIANQEGKTMEQPLSGKVAVVTGAASGIGLATSRYLGKAGARVVMVDRDEAAVTERADALGAAAHVCDLVDPQQCAAMVPDIIASVGRIDILHCNAGIYIGGDLEETDAEAIDAMLGLNVNVVMKNVHAVIPHMKNRGGGDIVVTSSLAGHTAVPWEPVYSGSKFAVTCFVETMRRQLLSHDIRVGQVSPGPVITALLSDWPEENLQKARDSGAIIDPEEIADAILYMLTRKRNVTIRDIIIVPTKFDI